MNLNDNIFLNMVILFFYHLYYFQVSEYVKKGKPLRSDEQSCLEHVFSCQMLEFYQLLPKSKQKRKKEMNEEGKKNGKELFYNNIDSPPPLILLFITDLHIF